MARWSVVTLIPWWTRRAGAARINDAPSAGAQCSARQDASRRARVWREARATARVNHPGVCQIYDVGEVGGDPFLVMELLTGRSLAARLQTGPLPFEESIRVALINAPA